MTTSPHPPSIPLAERDHPTDERFRVLVESVQDYAIFMLDPQGRIASWNAGAQRLKGYAAAEVIGRHFELFYPPDAIERDWPREELRRALKFGRVEDEGWRLRKDGSRFWASVVITALFDDSGVLQGYAKVTRDLTERRAHEEALRQSEEQLRLLMGAVADYAIFMLDGEGQVLTWNGGAERITGYQEHEVLGRHFSMFFTADDVAAGVPARELVVAGRDGRAEAEGWRVRKGGDTFWAAAVITPVIGPGGDLRGYAKVIRDLSEPRRAAELERSSRRMEEFLAMLAHELRNPLAPLRNAVEIMSLKGGLPPYMSSVTGMIDRQVRQLTRLVDDLLDVARISTGKISMRREAIDFRAVVLASVETARAGIDLKRQSLTVDLPDEPLPATGDAARLGQALQNLLNNASRYTPQGGSIRLAARHQGKALVTTVSDNGIGLAPDSLERIFDLFAQERVARDPGDSGLGIGLSLARKVIELHAGSLTAYSAGPGQGSSFSMLLPANAAPPQPATARPVEAQVSGRRVLVVDDNVDSTDSTVTMLNLLGHVAQGAYSGEQGLAEAEVFLPDLVLLDLNMPDLDGFAVVRRLRTRFGNQLMIAALTGYGRQGDRRTTLETGFDAHLTKPVGLEQLQRVLNAGPILRRPTPRPA
jgi:PAS domain S-box-containing protein